MNTGNRKRYSSLHFYQILIIGSAFLFHAALFAATPLGRLTGSVTDAAADEPLPGANIMIKGTVLGAASDADGSFVLNRIPPGQYDILFTMMGYETYIEKKVSISPDETVTLDIKLSEAAIQTEELVVTASKRAQKVDDTPNSIAVVSSKEIERRNLIYLDQLLEVVPGVNFMGEQVNIRGSSGFSYGVGSRVLFLVDGIPVMTGDTGEINWDFIPVSQIRQIEIVKSAGSALYGSSALGGIINVITKEAALEPETNVRVSFGMYDDPPWKEWQWSEDGLFFHDLDVDHSRKIGAHSIFFSLGKHASDGYQENGEYARYNGSAKGFFKLTPQSNLTISTNFETGKSGIGVMWFNRNKALEVEPLAVGDEVRSNRLSVNAVHQWAVNQSFGLKNRVSYFRSHFEDFMHDNRDHSTAQKFGYEAQGNWIVNSHSFTFGTEESFDKVAFYPLGNFDILTASAYAQDEFHLLPTLILTAGARYDYTITDGDLEDSEISPKFGLVYHVTDKSSFRIASGKGFRAPSISERFPNIYASGLKVIPNPGLGSERAWSHEIGFGTPLCRQLYLDAAVFRNDYWDLIEPVPDVNNTVQFINLTRARINGVETVLKYGLFDRRVSGQLGYTWLDPRDLDLDEVLGYRSRHMFNGSVAGHYGNVELGLDYQHYAKLEKVKLYPQDPRVDQKVLNVHMTVDLKSVMITGSVNNFFNRMQTQYERTIMPIRNYTTAIKWKI